MIGDQFDHSIYNYIISMHLKPSYDSTRWGCKESGQRCHLKSKEYQQNQDSGDLLQGEA